MQSLSATCSHSCGAVLPRRLPLRGSVSHLKSREVPSPSRRCIRRGHLAPLNATQGDNEGAGLETSSGTQPTKLQSILSPDPSELPNDFQMPIWDHLEELRERVMIGGLAALVAITVCFCFSKDLVVFLEAPVAMKGVRFLQLSPGEFFFTTFKVAGYSGLLLATPTILYQIISYIIPGLTSSEKRLLAPVMFGSSLLFFIGILFAYEILTPAALNFFVDYSDGAVESLWSIDQYFSFVVVLLLSAGLSFQVPVIQILLGQFGLVSSKQFFAQWRFTQTLLAVPLIGLYMGGALAVKLLEKPSEA